MRLGTRGHYAILALLDLDMHGHDRPVRLNEIAARQNLPLPYLEQLFNALKKCGIVISHRGRVGGYSLAAPAHATRVTLILRAVDEDIKARHCAAHEEAGCRGHTAKCLLHAFWAHLENHVQSYLDSLSLADVAAMGSVLEGVAGLGALEVPVSVGGLPESPLNAGVDCGLTPSSGGCS